MGCVVGGILFRSLILGYILTSGEWWVGRKWRRCGGEYDLGVSEDGGTDDMSL